MSIEERLREIEAREQAATPGPWGYWSEDDHDIYTEATDISERQWIIVTEGGYYPPRKLDGDFIIAARVDILWLTRRLREAMALLVELLLVDDELPSSDWTGQPYCLKCSGKPAWAVGRGATETFFVHSESCPYERTRKWLEGE